MQHSVIVKRFGEPSQILTVDEELMYDLRNLIGCDSVESIPFGDGLFLLVDEDGLYKYTEINFLLRVNSPKWPIQKICGTAVLVRASRRLIDDAYDFFIQELTTSDIQLFGSLLTDKYQAAARDQFIDYKPGFEFVVMEEK